MVFVCRVPAILNWGCMYPLIAASQAAKLRLNAETRLRYLLLNDLFFEGDSDEKKVSFLLGFLHSSC